MVNKVNCLDSPYSHKKFSKTKQLSESVDDICKNIWSKKKRIVGSAEDTDKSDGSPALRSVHCNFLSSLSALL